MKCLNETVYCTYTFKGLKDSGRYMKIWKTIQGVGGHWLLETRQLLLVFVKLWLETIKWPLNWWWRKCHILPEEWETGKYECNLFHTISWMNTFCQDGETLSGESQLGGVQPLTFLHLTSCQSTFIYSLKWKLPSKLQDFRMSQSSSRT